jgi:membrane-associated phospholipid phosphatase
MTATDSRPREVARSRAPAVAAVVLGIAGTAALTWFAVMTLPGQELDQRAMTTVTAGRDAQLWVLSVLGRVSIGAVLLVAIGCVVLALVRRQLPAAIAALVVIGGANVTTQLLKHLIIDRPDLGLEVGVLNSLPSGHTTVVASSAAALALVAPRALTPPVAAFAAFATALTGASTVVAGWHRPSDVLATLTVTLAWTGIAALLVRSDRRGVPPVGLLAWIASAGALVVLIVVGVRPDGGWSGLAETIAVLGVLGAAVALWATATVRLTR